MALRVALQIDGDASGATAAATQAKEAVAALPASAAAAAGQANAAVARSATAAAGSVKLSTQQLANMQFQLQDIAVGLASGQSPFLVMAQQGSQIVQAFAGGTGVAVALRAVGAGIVTFVTNPLNLMVLGFGLAATAASALFSAVSSGAASTDDLLARHEELIGKIKNAWPQATEGVREYARESIAVLDTQLRADAERLRTQLAGVIRDAEAELKSFQPADALSLTFALKPEFEPFREAVAALAAEARSGTPGILGFRRAVAEIAATDPENAALQTLAGRLLAVTDDAAEVATALRAAEDAIRRTGGEAATQTEAVSAFGDALKALSGIALPDLSDRARAAQEFDQALRNASGTEERQVAFAAYEQALARIKMAEDDAASAAAARGAASASASRATAAGARTATVYLDDLDAAQKAVIAKWDAMRGAAGNAFSTILTGIRDGTRAGDLLLRLAGQIGDAFIRAGAAAASSGLFGASGAAPGGIFGPLLGGGSASLFTTAGLYHSGGAVGPAPPSRRTVPAAVFAPAPRLHSGLGPNEFPAILERGETVTPRGRSAGPAVNIYVTTPSPRAFAESRALVARAAGRLVSRAGRHL